MYVYRFLYLYIYIYIYSCGPWGHFVSKTDQCEHVSQTLYKHISGNNLKIQNKWHLQICISTHSMRRFRLYCNIMSQQFIRVRGYPLNGIFGPCVCVCVFACWWLLGMAVVGSSSPLSSSVSFCASTTWRDLKIDKNWLNPQDTCSKQPGSCFLLRSRKRCRQLRHRHTGLAGPGIDKHEQIHKILQNSRGVFFLRSPKCRRQLRRRCTGLGDYETDNKSTFPVSNMLTVQKIKLEILKCAWEQFPHIQNPDMTQIKKSDNSRVPGFFPNYCCPRRVLTQYLKGEWWWVAHGHSPTCGQHIPPASGACFPQPEVLVLKFSSQSS